MQERHLLIRNKIEIYVYSFSIISALYVFIGRNITKNIFTDLEFHYSLIYLLCIIVSLIIFFVKKKKTIFHYYIFGFFSGYIAQAISYLFVVMIADDGLKKLNIIFSFGFFYLFLYLSFRFFLLFGWLWSLCGFLTIFYFKKYKI